MGYSKEDDFADDCNLEGSEQENQAPEDVLETGGSDSGTSNDATAARRVGGEISLAERLRDIFIDEGDGDLLLQRNSGENSVMQWLQALDFQVIGACRADERLKPLLKLKVSRGVVEDRLLAHLSQHFEAPEVGMLARCLCIPLVSIRVGKVLKKAAFLCPTATRGNLNLTLLPSSDLCISFIGDDGCTERLAVLSGDSESSTVTIEGIPADDSGRSFLIKLPGCQLLYFWCSEKSKLLGDELLAKMKDLLCRKPSLSQLTGISESRFNCFATRIRAYLLGSGSVVQSTPTISSAVSPSDTPKSEPKTQSTVPTLKTPLSRSINQAAKSLSSIYQGSLSPRSNAFKDSLCRNTSSARNVAQEKLKRRGDSQSAWTVDDPSIASTSNFNATQKSSGQTEDEKISEGSDYRPFLSLSMPDTLPSSTPSSLSLLPINAPLSQALISSPPLFAPYYCWCPPCSSTLQYTVSPHLPLALTEPLSFPPLPPLLSAARSSTSLVPPNQSLDLSDVPSLDLPAFLPDSLARISLPVSSFVTMPSSQQIPTFTPFMSDPIVHIPVIDVCSSGQGYLVSAGPSISTSISPLLPNLVNPLIPEAESVVEKSTRETLRLIGSTQTFPPLMEMLPAALTVKDKSPSCLHGKTSLVAGSRGLYSGTRDVDATANSISAMGLASVPLSSAGCDDFGDSCGINSNYLEDRQGEGAGGGKNFETDN